MNRQDKKRNKIILICITIFINIGFLGFFKYSAFIIDNINALSDLLGIEKNNIHINIILPIGISFYTFMALSYIIDVYRKKIKAEKNFIKYALFVSFFPQILSGPIGRAPMLIPQINSLPYKNLYDLKRILSGLEMMLFGYFIKMVIGDRIAIFVNAVYGDYTSYGTTILIITAIFYSIQIYCDFAGYSYIAIGVARIMGINLMENFNTPYFSCSIQEFWRRWHISLSSWFRDYIYIPLGGNRRGIVYINIMVTFILSGIWHGSGLTFIAWGALHGFYQVVGKVFYKPKRLLEKKFAIRTCTFSYKLWQAILTFSLVSFAWIFFRADSLNIAINYIQRMFSVFDVWVLFDGSIYDIALDRREFLILFIAIIIMLVVDIYKRVTNQSIGRFLNRQWFPFRITIYIVAVLLIYIFGIYGSSFEASSFIYFKF
ncbi:MAG: MBOAT family protein [Clostridiales Family XIII bacterium]|jgi:D-alanyl-lipoteichoic acid acyltransferase DltB (MBOAT superfamily)|nr:MBOAT family protein [Clostridiales Family XIII bacterium]